MKPRIILDPDVFDTLELSALAYGGIGAGRWEAADGPHREYQPLCAGGHARDAGVPNPVWTLYDHGVTVTMNDSAVRAINLRKGAPIDGRVSFEEWTSELGVVRGE